jgi:hypothetical protein
VPISSGSSQRRRRDFDDIDAEFRLRKVEPPYEAVEAELAVERAELRRLGPEGAKTPELEKAIDEFLKERGKPSN